MKILFLAQHIIMTKLCSALFQYENKRNIGWDNWRSTFLFTQMRWPVEKGTSWARSRRKLNQETVEKWMLSQVSEELLELHVSISEGTVTKVVQKQIKAIYLTWEKDSQEVCNFFQHLKTHVWKWLRAFF